MCTQPSDRLIVNVDDAPGATGFHVRLDYTLAGSCDLVSKREPPGVEVCVAPAKTTELSSAHPGRRGQAEQEGVRLRARVLERQGQELPSLCGCPHLHLGRPRRTC